MEPLWKSLFNKAKDGLDSYLDSEMEKEFGTTDIEKAKEMNRARTEGYSFRKPKKGENQQAPSETVESEVVYGADIDGEVIDAELIED